jgi:hypothetical protein
MDNVKVNKYKGMGKGKKQYAKDIASAHIGKENVSFSDSRNAIILDTTKEEFKSLKDKIEALSPNFQVIKKAK